MKEKCLYIEEKLIKMFVHIHHFTYKNLLLVSISAIIATLGYIFNSGTVIVGSKLISTSLYPFILLALMAESQNFKHMSSPVFNILMIFILPILLSFIIGLTLSKYGHIDQPTEEMIKSSKKKYLLVEFLIAFLVGIAYYLAIELKNIVVFTGLLLCITVIPALCNAGLFYSFALNNYLTDKENKKDINENLLNGHKSINIFFFNAIGILLGMGIMFYTVC